jgi:small subunit ribosomal protein S3
VTDDSAFKRQVRSRMTETGEKYTVARRAVIEQAAQDAAIRDVVQQAIERAVGVSSLTIDRTAGLTRVTIRAARPGLLIGHRGAEADRLRTELAGVVGHPVELYLYEVSVPPNIYELSLPPEEPRG